MIILHMIYVYKAEPLSIQETYVDSIFSEQFLASTLTQWTNFDFLHRTIKKRPCFLKGYFMHGISNSILFAMSNSFHGLVLRVR